MKGIFITGTDTNVGKTYIASKIAAELNSRNINVVPRKPVESGCQLVKGQLIPNDAVNLQQAAHSAEPIRKICPYRFREAISPAQAARLNNQSISLQQLSEACTDNINKDAFLLVEGAGGIYSPICDEGLNADLAKKLELPVLLIAENRTGCINQVLLSLQAIQHNKLNIKAIVLNHMVHCTGLSCHYNELSRYTQIPIFEFDTNQTSIKKLTDFIID